MKQPLKNAVMHTHSLFQEQIKTIGTYHKKTKSWAVRHVMSFYVADKEKFSSAVNYFRNEFFIKDVHLKKKRSTIKFDVDIYNILKRYASEQPFKLSANELIRSMIDQYFNEEFKGNLEIPEALQKCFSKQKLKPNSIIITEDDVILFFKKSDIF